MSKHVSIITSSLFALTATTYLHTGNIFADIEKSWQTMEEQFNHDISNLKTFKHNLEYHIKDTVNADATTNNVQFDVQDNKDNIAITLIFDTPIKQDDIAITTQDNSLKGTITMEHGKVNLFISQHHDMITIDAQVDHHQEQTETKAEKDSKDAKQSAHIMSSGVSRFERVFEGTLAFDDVQAELEDQTLIITCVKKNTSKTVPVEITTNKHNHKHQQTTEKVEK
jgi:HSP20 family molecular chaperone IbpA